MDIEYESAGDHRTSDSQSGSQALDRGTALPESGHTPAVGLHSLVDAANALTLLGLLAAVACTMLAINQQLAYAIVALMLSGVCDLFDGVVARRCQRSPEQQAFGGRLDSIVDGCSFGLAPVVLVYAAGLRGLWEIPLLAWFAICVVGRLAYFDTVGLQNEGRKQYFVGLPVTYASVFLPLACLSGFGGAVWFRGCVAISMLALSLAMVSRRKFPKPSGIFYLLFPAAGLILTCIFLIYADEFRPQS